MKVKELLKKLEKADLEAEVVFDYDGGFMGVLYVEETTAKSDEGDIKFFVLKYDVDKEEDF